MTKKLLKLSKKYNFKVYQDKFYYEDVFVILKMEAEKFFIANKLPKSKFYEIKWSDLEKVFKDKSLKIDNITFQLSYNLIDFFENFSNKKNKNQNEFIKKELKEIQDKLDFVKIVALNLESFCKNLNMKL